MPSPEERLKIWKRNIPANATLAADLDLQHIAVKYELTGSAIVNAVHFACLQTISKESSTLSKQDVLEAIKLEHEKEDKVFN
jgi:ATP-dependent 26S proteasome regulatory subunit